MVGDGHAADADSGPISVNEGSLLEALRTLVTVDEEGTSCFYGDVKLKQELLRSLGAAGAGSQEETRDSMNAFNASLRRLLNNNLDLRIIMDTPGTYRVAVHESTKIRYASSYCINAHLLPGHNNSEPQSAARRSTRSSKLSKRPTCSCTPLHDGVYRAHSTRCPCFEFPQPPLFAATSEEFSLIYKLPDGPADGQALQSAPKPATPVSFRPSSKKAVTSRHLHLP
jgi:hypothetical protein